MPRYETRDPEPSREAKEVYQRWIDYLDREIGKHNSPGLRNELVHDNLHQLLLGTPKGGRLNFTLESELAYNVLQLGLDAKNITFRPEYFGDLDEEKYAPVRPLIFFWRMFDRSPVGLNCWLGFRFRAMLGKHIFKSIGNNVRIFHGVEFSFGYNLTIEDDCVIHRYAILDDRGEIILRRGTVLSDYAAVYSQAQDPVDRKVVENRVTEIGPNARLTYHSAVMAGVRVGEGAIVGAMGLATRPVEDRSIAGGVPAREIKKQDQARRFDENDEQQGSWEKKEDAAH